MLNVHQRYCSETYNKKGQLESFHTNIPPTFNFAYDVVDEIAKAEPDRRAMVWLNPEGERHTFTFDDMRRWSNKAAQVLAAQGIGRGDRVLVVLRRHYQFWFVALALHKLGAIMVPATFMLKEHDLAYRLQAAGISAVIATSVGTFADICDAVIPSCPTVRVRLLVHGAGGGLGVKGDDGVYRDTDESVIGAPLSGPEGLCACSAEREGWLDFNGLCRAASDEFDRRPTSADEGMLMYFTSGTSGEPKMALHNAGYAVAHLVTAKHWHGVHPDGLHLTVADTGWGKAVWGKFYGQWFMEAAVLTYDFDRFDASEILSLIQNEGVTTLCCPPTMYRLMMRENVDAWDLSSLKRLTTAGEALNPDLFEFWKQHTGLQIFEGFGQTETPLTVANLIGSEPCPGSMGKPSPLYHVEVLRDDGTPCDPGEVGEICIDISQNPAGIMMGYYLEPLKTARVMHDGWYHTGDTAWEDEFGRLWYMGRNDDVIKSSGYRIGPFEIESVLLEHQAVRECAVTGVPDPVRGMAVKATIVLHSGFTGSEILTADLQNWVKSRTAPYKYPRIVEYVQSLPRTTNDKVRRSEIRAADGAKGVVHDDRCQA